MAASPVLLLVLSSAVLLNLACAVPDASCACTDEPPKSGQPCEDLRAAGKCALRAVKRENYCSLTCGYCKCDEGEEESPAPAPASTEDCASCPDIPPAGDYTCEEQAALGKCVRGWMEGFCLRSCKKCSCDGSIPLATEPVEPSVPDAPEANVTSAKSFQIPVLESGQAGNQTSQLTPTAVTDDASVPDTQASANPQQDDVGLTAQATAEDPQVENIPASNSTTIMEEGAQEQAQNNSTDIAPTQGETEEATLAEKKPVDIVPTGESMVAQIQSNVTDLVSNREEMEESVQVQSNSTSTVPTAEEVESTQVPNNSTSTVPTAEEVEESVQVPNNSTSTVLSAQEPEESVQPQNNSAIAVPAPLQEAATESGAANQTLSDLEGNDGPAPVPEAAAPISPAATQSIEPLPENNIYSSVQGINPSTVESNRSAEVLEEDGCQTIMELISKNERLARLSDAVRVADIELALEDSAMDITFFAPTNSAFESLSNLIGDGAAEILARPEVMKLILSNHASRPGRSVNEILNVQSISTLSVVEGNTSQLKVTRGSEGQVLIDGKINRAEITTQDISACGGYLHIINVVLLPVDYNELKKVS